MAFSPDIRRAGQGALQIASVTGGTRLVTVTHPNGTGNIDDNHVDGTSLTLTVAESVGGVGPPTGEWWLAVVEDNSDTGGVYTGGGVVMALVDLGTGGALPATVNVSGLSKGGTYRLVVLVGDADARAQSAAAVDTGGTSTQYHHDSDGNTAQGGLNTVTVSAGSRVIGGAGHRLVWTARNATGATGAGGKFRNKDTMVLAGSLRPANATGSALINPKAVKVSLPTDTAGATRPDGVYRPTPNTTGDYTQGGVLVDTDFGEVLGGTAHYHQVGVNDVLGDTTTPAGEQAGIWSSGTIEGATTTQRAWCRFSSSGHVASTTAASDDRLRSTNTEVTASAALQLSSTDPASALTAGVLTFTDSGRTLANRLFNRRQSASLAGPHGQCWFRAWLADAYDGALASAAVTLRSLDSDGTQEDTQDLTSSAAALLEWTHVMGDTHKAFNAFRRTGPDDPSSLGAHDVAVPQADIHKPAGTKTSTYPDPKDQTLTRDFAAATIPGRAKDVRVLGRAFSGGKEPVRTYADEFAVASEIIFAGMFTANTSDDANDANGAPTGPVKRSKPTAAGSFIAKTSSLVSEATFAVADLAKHNPTDRAGRPYAYSGGFEFAGRRAVYNATQVGLAPADAGTTLGSQQNLETPLGYSIHGTPSQTFDTITPPGDAATIRYYQGWSNLTATRDTFGLPSASTDTPGFTTDSGLFGFRLQVLRYTLIRDDLYGEIILEPMLVIPGGSVEVKVKAWQLLPSKELVPKNFDDAPVLYIGRLNAAGTPLTNIDTLAPTPIGAAPTGDYESSYAPAPAPAGELATYQVFGFGNIDGSPVVFAGQSFTVGFRDNSINLTLLAGNFAGSGHHWQVGEPFTVALLALRATSGSIPESIPLLVDDEVRAVTGVDQGTKTFTVAGDQTALFLRGLLLSVSGSTGNDGTYRVEGASLDGGNTDVEVVEAIPSATADGSITINVAQPTVLVLNAVGGNLQPDGTFGAPLTPLGLSGTGTFTWPGEQTAAWPLNDLFLFAQATADDGGKTTPMEANRRFEVIGSRNRHDGPRFDGPGFLGYPTRD